MMDTGATGRAGSAAATATILSVDHYGGDIQFYCVDSHASGGEATGGTSISTNTHAPTHTHTHTFAQYTHTAAREQWEQWVQGEQQK